MATDPRTIAAAEMISGGSAMVCKPVRAGLTTSAVYACLNENKRLLIIPPTINILSKTVEDAANGETVFVPGNSACPLIKSELIAHPILRKLPISLQNCDDCPLLGYCDVTKILKVESPKIMGLTYAKLEALMLSKSERSKDILEKIAEADVVLCDEAHTIALGSAPKVPFSASPNIPKGYDVLQRVIERWGVLQVEYAKVASDLSEEAKTGHTAWVLSQNIWLDRISWNDLRGAWSELVELAKSGFETSVVLQIRDIITILSAPTGSIGYISENNGETGQIYISASQERGVRALSEFFRTYSPYSKVFFASATLIEPHPGFFKEIADRPLKQVAYPDVLDISSKTTLLPDRWRLNSKNWTKKLPTIVETIGAIAKREKQPIYLLAPNGRKAENLKAELQKAGIEGIYVDYYRSDKSIGVERSERVAICVGMAEVPVNVFDGLARGANEDEKWLDSRALRQQSVEAATFQALCRVRDPEGQQDSRVYMIGCRLDQVRNLSRWGTDRRQVKVEEKTFNGSRGETFKKAIFKVEIDQPTEHCNIFGESSKQNRSDQRSVNEYIYKIDLYADDIPEVKNHYIFSINIIREKVAILGFYNRPSEDCEIESNSVSLCKYFVNRSDCYAQQSKRRDGKATWKKIEKPIDSNVLTFHQYRGSGFAAGTYQIDPKTDLVVWGCFDVDGHSERERAEVPEKIAALVEVLRRYCIPFMVEASGSPGSYHIWIFFEKTKTYNAFRFMRQVASEAKVKGIEIFPKQKKIKGKKAFGNPVKLPLGFNQKTDTRCVFVDPDSLEPLEGFVSLPGIVKLLEIPEIKPGTVGAQGMPKVKRMRSVKASLNVGDELDYCMSNALHDDLQLVGGEGNALRVAIAVKALNSGMSIDEVVKLFEKQENFDAETSRKYIEDLSERGYSTWSCEALRDRCGDLVKRYCPTCPFASREIRGVDEAAR